MKNNKKAIIFEIQKKNFYSLTPLIATIDQEKGLEELDLVILENIDTKVIKRLLQRYQSIVIGTSFRTAQLKEIYEKMKNFYSSLNSEELDRLLFIAGGSHPTGDPFATLRIGFDVSFIGEAEYSLPAFLKNYLEGNDIYSSPGIAFIDNDSEEIIFTQKPHLINLDDYPFISKERGYYPPLEITRGCAFGCTFCQVPTMFAHKTRHRSPDILIETVKWMVTQELNDIRFITPNSFGYMSSRVREINKEAILYLLKSLKSIKGVRDIYYGTFPGEVRPETVTEDLMLDIKPFITNRRISIGLQSGSEEVLKRIHRGHTVDESVNAIDVLLKSGFIPVVDIIIGLPGATEKDEFKTIETIERLVEKDCIIRAHVFMPLPGTALEKVQYKPTYSKIRKVLGRLNSQGKIEGSWSQQEKYASDSWKITQTITSLPAIKR